MTKSRGILPPRKVWSDEELALLRKRYPDESASVIAAAIGCRIDLVYAKAYRLGLKKSDAFKSSTASGRLDGIRGADSRFKKGQIPPNKGVKGVSYPGMAATQFKKGITPHNSVPVGTTVMATDGYLKTKTAEPNQWQWTHRMNWESVHGPIDKGMMLVFKTADHENCDPSNLELITRQEHMKRHTLHNYPKELTQLLLLTGAIQRKINRRLKDERATTTTNE